VQTWLPGTTAYDDDPGHSTAFAHDLASLSPTFGRSTPGARTFAGSGRGGDIWAEDGWMATCFARSTQLLDVSTMSRTGRRTLDRVLAASSCR
jgi:hypothetical protein